jgi:hypothetical protein
MNLWIWIGIAAVLLWAINGLVREYVIARLLHASYQRKLHMILSDPNARPKGRFE